MKQQELRDLLARYARGECTLQEEKMLEDMILRKPLIKDWDWSSEEERILMSIRIKQSIDQQRLPRSRQTTTRLWKAGIAASLLLVLGSALFIFFQEEKPRENKELTKTLVINEKVDSAEGITLTLADGKVIQLEAQANGVISNGEGVAIKKTGDAQLIYEGGAADAGNKYRPAAMNTIRVPNGKQFRLTLPDGTRVWLNTATTFTYPVAFVGNERNVTLEGEAYFEVAQDKNKPFLVLANNTTIAVTGTHFNVSAYLTDKSVTTTLLEGGVNIHKQGSQLKITPGFQAVTYDGNNEIAQYKANIENTMAWYNGYFVFEGKDIVSIMRSVARWYDIEVVIEGDISSKKFGGTYPITAELDELLADLGTIGNIHFTQNGKEVRVMP